MEDTRTENGFVLSLAASEDELMGGWGLDEPVEWRDIEL